MTKTWIARLLAPLVLLCGATNALAVPPPAEAFGELPKLTSVSLSPSGQLVAWGDNSDREPKVRVFDLAQQKMVRVIGIESGVTLRRILWPDDETLLLDVSLRATYSTVGGSRYQQEVFRTLAADVSGGPTRILLMGEEHAFQSGSNLLALRTAKPKTVLMWTWAEGPRDSGWVASVYEVDIRTGDGKLITQGTALTDEWLADRSGRPVVRGDWNPQHKSYQLLADVNGSWREIHRQAGQGELGLYGLSADGASVIAVGSLGQSRERLLSIPLDGSGAKVLLEDPQRDVEKVVLDPYTRAPLGAWLSGLVDEVRWLEPRAETQQQAVSRAFPDRRALIVSRSENGKRVVVDVSSASHPTTYYVVDFSTGKADIIGEQYPALADTTLGEVRTISYKARDGVDIPAYVTVPPGAKAEKLPLVVLPHGGPESRDEPEFDWLAQYLANRGYLVLQPQFRGSTGFGEAHRLAGRRQWGGLMQDDVTDGVKALTAQGLADPARVCIVGAHYGGYAALAGATFTPDLYKCAVSINGVSDLPGLLKNAADRATTDSDVYRYLVDIVGPPSDPWLTDKSPARAAKNVRAPILLLHSAEDNVFPFSQAEKMAKALEKAGKPHDFVKLPGDDHWLARSDTRINVLTVLGTFLATNL